MLVQAREAEVEGHIAIHADLTDAQGRRRIVRHGHLPEREIQTGTAAVRVKAPRVRDRNPAAPGGRIRFTSSILPPYHQDLEDRIGIQTYFCDPHSPWQRGSIENTNGLLRRDMPRKTHISNYSDRDIADLTWAVNSTPRKCLGFKTPAEAFLENIKGVALEV